MTEFSTKHKQKNSSRREDEPGGAAQEERDVLPVRPVAEP